MILKEYTVKKALGEKLTTKSPNGSYDSQENSAEVTMTWDTEGSPINVEECNKICVRQAKRVLDGEVKEDEKWLDEAPVTTNPAGKKSVGTVQAELIK